MGLPISTGILRNRIQDMAKGDILKGGYKATSNTIMGMLTLIGVDSLTELPLTPINAPNGYFFWHKVDKGLLVADRNIHLISATAFDTNNAFYNGSTAFDIGLNMTSPTLITNGLSYSKVINGVTVTITATSFYNLNYECFRMLGTTGGADGDRWLSDNNLSNTITIDLGEETNIAGYSFQTTTMVNASPKEFKVYISSDGVSYTQVDHITNNPANNAVNTYFLTSVMKGKYIKFELINNNGYSGNYKYDIADLKIYRDDFGMKDGILRVLDGGTCFANARGEKTITFDSRYGVFPIHNEWEKYIVNSTLEDKITAGDDNAWHWSNKESWTQGYANEIMSSVYAYSRVIRGGTGVNKLSFLDSSSASLLAGYRPVYEYKEV